MKTFKELTEKTLNEGRMKELHGYIERGMSAQQIAKKMKLDVKTIKALMPKKESIEEASIYREYEPGEDYQRDLKYFQTVIKKLRGKVKSMNKPTRKDPYLEIEVDGVDAKKLRREIMKDDDGMTQIEEAKDTFVVYKSVGIGKIKKLATINSMPKGKMLDKVLDKYDADGVMAMSKITRNKVKVEAVEESLDEGVGEVLLALNFAMFGAVALTFITTVGMELGVIKGSESELKTAKNDIDRLKRKIQKNKQYKLDSIDKEKLNNALKIIRNAKPTSFEKLKTKLKSLVKKNKTVKESRAYRDAMKGMKSRSATRGMATTKKDKDTEASDDDRKSASKNIIMQLRKASDLPTGANIEFEKGKGKIDRATAQNVLAKFNRLQKPIDKEKFQNSIKSLADIKKILGR